MRIKVVRRPTIAEVDGINLESFAPGERYDVGATRAALLLAEGWAAGDIDLGGEFERRRRPRRPHPDHD